MLLRVSVLAAACSAAGAYVFTPFPGGGYLFADVASASSFRLGVRFGGWAGDALSSPSLDPARQPAPSSPVAWGNLAGIQTSFGALLLAKDGSGGWVLYDANNKTLVSSGGAPWQKPPQNSGAGTRVDNGIVLPVNGTAASGGPARSANCLGNGDFGPPFYYNRAGGYLSFSVSSWLYDPDFPHCYPTDFAGSVGAERGAQSGVLPDTCLSQLVNTAALNPVRSDKYPNGLSGSTAAGWGEGGGGGPPLPGFYSAAACCAACNSDPSCVAWSWSDGTHANPGGNCWPLKGFEGTQQGAGHVTGGSPPQHTWWAMGSAADWYLAPTAAPLDYTRALYQLTGAPAVPPRYAFGFHACYWSYDEMEEVEGNMTVRGGGAGRDWSAPRPSPLPLPPQAFRAGSYPVDSFIMDYDWWSPDELYSNAKELDFSYDPTMWGPHTFPGGVHTDGAPALLAHFHEDLHMRFGGIRKPRTYSNKALSSASGWLLPAAFEVGAGGNNWNMSAPGWADWYVANHAHFLLDGVDYWWNDEGETQWFTFLWWTQAQAAEFAAAKPNSRYWTINRSFQPGMQRDGGTTWTGDSQDCGHAKTLAFTTAGQPYTACDMTSPDATVLVRQYWNAVFLPIMHVHQMHGKPRFPYLWGGADAQAGFRAALNARYTFLPHIYSLAHLTHDSYVPMALPASYVFPDDPTFPAPIGDTVLMFGDCLVPAAVSTAIGDDPNENTTVAVLPPGTYYAFNSTAAVPGLQTITYTDVPLDQLVLFVRAGAILCLQAGPAPIQYSDQMGGELDVQVYAGRDGAFTLVEDDGASLDYAGGNASSATRRTAWAWDDAGRSLTWAVSGGFATGPNLFTTASVTLFDAKCNVPVTKGPMVLGVGGSLQF